MNQSDQRRWVASVASTEPKSNNIRKKRDKPPPKLPCDDNNNLKSLQLEGLHKLNYRKWLKNQLMLAKESLFLRKLETFVDYMDDADNSTHDGKLTKLVSTKQKPKTVSGDDDLPQRDDIGERHRKFELKVLVGAGVKSEEDGRNESEAFASDEDNDKDDDDNDTIDSDGESNGSEDKFYKQVKQKKKLNELPKQKSTQGNHHRPCHYQKAWIESD